MQRSMVTVLGRQAQRTELDGHGRRAVASVVKTGASLSRSVSQSKGPKGPTRPDDGHWTFIDNDEGNAVYSWGEAWPGLALRGHRAHAPHGPPGAVGQTASPSMPVLGWSWLVGPS